MNDRATQTHRQRDLAKLFLGGTAENVDQRRYMNQPMREIGGNMQPPDPPKTGRDEPSDGGDMADLLSRVTRLEQGLIGSFLFLIAAIGGLYLYIGSQIDGAEGRITQLSDRVSAVEATTARLDERTTAMQKQMDGMDAKLDKLLAK